MSRVTKVHRTIGMIIECELALRRISLATNNVQFEVWRQRDRLQRLPVEKREYPLPLQINRADEIMPAARLHGCILKYVDERLAIEREVQPPTLAVKADPTVRITAGKNVFGINYVTI